MITDIDEQEKHADVFKINQKQYLFSGLSHEEMVMFVYFWEAWVRNYYCWRNIMIVR